MPLVAGLDIGTSSTKIVVLDEDGSIVATHSKFYELCSPQPGWSEQDPADWLEATNECLERIADLEVRSIGVTGQMHGLVPLDQNGDVIRPAMLWNDQRTGEECKEWEEKVGTKALRDTIFNAPMTGFQIPKLLWMRNQEPQNYSRIKSSLLPKDYIAFKVTGERGADPADASGTGIFDVSQGCWSQFIAESLQIDIKMFPTIVDCAVGRDELGRNWYLAGGDQSANGVGTGCFDSNQRSLSLGSSAVIFSPSLKPRFHKSETLNCFSHISGGWLVMAVSLNGALALDTFMRQWLPGVNIADLSQLAATSGPGSNGVRVYPYFGGERCPINDPELSPKVEGFGPQTAEGDLARAILEGITFNLVVANQYIDQVAGQANSIVVSGGGSKNDSWLQIFADAFETPICRTSTAEGPAFGAAIVAGVREGIWSSFEETSQFSRRIVQTFEPRADLQSAFDQWMRGFPAESLGLS